MKIFLPKSGLLTFIFLVSSSFFANAVFSQATVTTEKRHGEPTTFFTVTSADFQSNYNIISPFMKPSPT
jgi:hypothetical protein